jgi:hypothetical protein
VISTFTAVRRSLGAALAALMMSQSVAIPLLDRADRVGVPVVESEHNASTCVRGHDHTICTQFSANRQISTDAPRHGGLSRETAASIGVDHEVATWLAAPTTERTRAPPLA